jgi:hypothetical protein
MKQHSAQSVVVSTAATTRRRAGYHCWDITQNFRLSDFLPPSYANAIGVQQHYYCSDGHGGQSCPPSPWPLLFSLSLSLARSLFGSSSVLLVWELGGNLGDNIFPMNKQRWIMVWLSLGTDFHWEHWGNSCCCSNEKEFISEPSLFGNFDWELR